ncbi:hypothetical protein SARC_09760 [Sphaeroforma arctica JP610]|uniref:RGS domain-containing protein n=1 Tax=Sphaeroforma arctica JP610 TaxID=667725 RepID=A0A0L0FLY5_9EUKA|nr:hypothetical protein SARC_09760 [Sphaeroforma arctica JP610]KNC77789.1 hypothetical protein SARC_09760 [Sphaeroforma arctica JP610]|eukprot:XP_014151691.1 hypothetical protein SARC_09760 [Sphaeroforma arctica JP610]
MEGSANLEIVVDPKTSSTGQSSIELESVGSMVTSSSSGQVHDKLDVLKSPLVGTFESTSCPKKNQFFIPSSPLKISSEDEIRDAHCSTEYDTRQKYKARVEEVRKAYNLYSWVLALIVYPLVFLLGALFYWLTSSAADEDIVLQKGYMAFTYVCIAHGGTVVCLLLLVVFFVKYWNEPEVRSRHHGFIVHYCVCAFLLEVSVLCTAALLLQITSLKGLNADGKTLNEVWVQTVFVSLVFMNFCALSTIVPIVARMHYIFELTGNRNIEPRYWKVPVFYLVLYVCTSFTSLMACRYIKDDCTTAETYSGTITFLVVCIVHYYVCAWRARSARKSFNDYWGNVRMFTTFTIFVGSVVSFGMVVNHPLNVIILWFYEPLMKVWIFGLEHFAFVAVRVLSRHWKGVETLSNIDMTGDHYREMAYTEGVVGLLKIEETAALFLEFSRKTVRQESILFLVAVLKGRTCRTKAEQEATRKHILETYIATQSVHQVNISHLERNTIIGRLSNKQYTESVPMEVFDGAFREITLLVTSNLLATFLASEEYQAWTQKMDREDKLVALLRQNQLLNVC